ncbi:hypothetical protein HMPREF0262_02452 [Clostridium sp. ATCC 29733]|nr:hypothetical protein HMPREF0262_02452 [Clostridium sp. ATCC 29733]
MFFHILLKRAVHAFIIPVFFRVNITKRIAGIRPFFQTDWLIGNKRPPMIYYNPVGNLTWIATHFVIVANFVQIHSFGNCTSVNTRTGKQHWFVQYRYLLESFFHCI